MIRKQVIEHRQLVWLTASSLTTETVVSLPNYLANIAKTDIWFTQIIPILYALLIASFFYGLSKKFPQKNIFEIISLLLGNRLGRIVNIVFLFYIWLSLVRNLSRVSGFVGFVLLPKTPHEVILFLFILVLIYYGKTSIEVVARVNALFVPFNLLMTVMLPFLLANELKVEQALPILSNGFLPLGAVNVMSLGYYGDLLILGAFLPSLRDPRLFKASVRFGALLAGVVLTLAFFVGVSVMGDSITSKFYYPIYLLVEQIHITDFLDRVEVILFSIWFPAYSLKILIIYFAFFICLSAVLNVDCHKFNFQGGIFVYLTAEFSFQRISDIASFSAYSLPLIVIGFQPVLILILYTVSKLRKKSINTSMTSMDGYDDPVESEEKENGKAVGGKKEKISKSTWFTWSALAFVILGEQLHSYSMWFAIASAVAYSVSLFLALWFSFRTLKKVSKHTRQNQAQAASRQLKLPRDEQI